jgi:hypothetical protein
MQKPSEEQQFVIDTIISGKNVVVDACAGSGKSTTILSCANQFQDKTFLQMTFNKELRIEVKETTDKYQIKNILIYTFHSLAVTYYYNQAFSCNSSILNSLELINNKYTRFNYARNRQMILQSGFLSNGTQQAITFFNNLFVRNNNLKVNSKINSLFSKKLRSQKRFRSVALSFNSTHRFKSSTETKSFFKIYSVIKSQRNSFLNNDGAQFPQNR